MKDQKSKILLVVLFVVFWSFWLFNIRVANDFPWISQEALRDRFGLPQIWTIKGAVGLGEYALATLWNWPIDLLYGVGARLGLNFAMLERLLGIVPYLLIGIYSSNKLSEHLEIKGSGRFVGSLFYLLNTYILLIIDGGQFNIALAYAWFPLAYLWVIKALRSGLSNKLLAGLGVSVIGYFDIRFVYVLFVLIFLKFIYELIFINYKEWIWEIRSWVITGIVVGIVFVGLHAYWILPSVLAKAPQLPAGYGDVSQTSFLSFATLGHGLLLLQPHWYKNVFGKVISLQPQFYLIPILVFLTPFFARSVKTSRSARRINKEVGFWLVIALTGVFLVKGSLEPWEAFYPFFFQNIPGMAMFRDPTKFFFLVAISYSVLIGYTTMFLTKRFGWILSNLIHPRGVIHIDNKLKNPTPGVVEKRVTSIYKKLKSSTPGEYFLEIKIIPLLLTIYFLLLISPIWTGKMTGTFSEPYNKHEFLDAAEEIENDGEFGRILYIPSRPPMGYASPTHPSIEANRLLSLRPFALGTIGTYETLNYLREAEYMGELLDVSAVSYIAYPYPDERREELKEDNVEYYYAFLDQLTKLPWTGDTITKPPVAVIKTRESQDHVFVAGNKFNVIGSLAILNEMVKIPGFDLKNNMLTFAEQDLDSVLQSSFDKIEDEYILYNKNELDLAAGFIDQSRIISPADNIPSEPSTTEGQQGWWSRNGNKVIEWRSFLQEKYGIDNQDFPINGGWAVAEGEKELEIGRIAPAIKGDQLLARVMFSSQGGKMEFYSENEKIGEIETFIDDPETVELELAGYDEIPEQVFEYDSAEFHWVEVGQLPVSMEPIVVKTNGELNVINQIAYVHQDGWAEHKRKVIDLSEAGKIIKWEELSSDEKEIMFVKQISPKVNYERINSTEYRVSVDANTFPAYLIFSETFDEGWKLKRISDGLNLESDPAYTFLNGFFLPSGGEYELYYEPQKYILPGLILSIITLSLVIFFLRKDES